MTTTISLLHTTGDPTATSETTEGMSRALTATWGMRFTTKGRGKWIPIDQDFMSLYNISQVYPTYELPK